MRKKRPHHQGPNRPGETVKPGLPTRPAARAKPSVPTQPGDIALPEKLAWLADLVRLMPPLQPGEAVDTAAVSELITSITGKDVLPGMRKTTVRKGHSTGKNSLPKDPPTLDEWRALYQQASRIRDLAPWNRIADHEIVV